MIVLALGLVLHCAPAVHRTHVVLGAPVSARLGYCVPPSTENARPPMARDDGGRT